MENIHMLTEILKELQTITQEITKSTPFKSAFDGLDKTISIFNGLNDAVKNYRSNIKPLVEKISEISKVLSENSFELIKNAAEWVAQTAQTTAATVATWAQETAVKVLNSSLVQNTIEVFKNIAAWVSQAAQTAAATIATWAQNAAQGALNAITQIGTALQSALNFVMSMNPIALVIIAITALVAAFVLLWNKCDGFREFWMNLFDKIKTVALGVFDLFKERFQAIIDFVRNTIENIKTVFGGIVEFVKGVFTGDWKRAFEGLKDIVGGVFSQLQNIVKTPINFIIDGLNMLLKGLNKIKFELPDWVPVIGGKGFAFNIPLIPRLASGGFPSMGQMFIAREAGPELVGTIGGRNAVVNNNQIVESVSAGVYKAVREAMGSGNRSDKIVMTLDKKVLGEATIGYINGKTKQTGVTPILV